MSIGTNVLLALLLVLPAHAGIVQHSGKKSDDMTLWNSHESVGTFDSTECASGTETSWGDEGLGFADCTAITGANCMNGDCWDCDVDDLMELGTDTGSILDVDADWTICLAYQFDDLIEGGQLTETDTDNTAVDPDNVIMFLALTGLTGADENVTIQPNHSVDDGTTPDLDQEFCDPGGGIGVSINDLSTETNYGDSNGIENGTGSPCDLNVDDGFQTECDFDSSDCVVNTLQDEWQVVCFEMIYTAGDDRDNLGWVHTWGAGNTFTQELKWGRNQTTSSDFDPIVRIWSGGRSNATSYTGDVILDGVAIWQTANVYKPWEVLAFAQAPTGACP